MRFPKEEEQLNRTFCTTAAGRTQVSARISTAPANLKESLQYRQLGESDLVVSEVTLGTMTWGNQNTEQEAHDQLCYAFDNGVNILDTAEMVRRPFRSHSDP